MPPVKLSVACMAITDSIVENYGEIILSDTNAEQIFTSKVIRSLYGNYRLDC